MVAIRAFKEMVQAALDEGIDLLIAGAGFSRDVFTWCREAGTPMVPIVGSPRVAKLAEKFGAAAVVVEGFEAGGHLGTDRLMLDLLPEIVAVGPHPGDRRRRHHHRARHPQGARARARPGVQMGTRFAATVESSAPEAFKQMYVDATPDEVVLVKSPVGLPGRALKNPFWERTQAGDYPPIKRCISCLKECHKEYCIINELEMAQGGDVEQGLVFSGSAAADIHDIPTVAALMTRLESEYSDAAEEEQA